MTDPDPIARLDPKTKELLVDLLMDLHDREFRLELAVMEVERQWAEWTRFSKGDAHTSKNVHAFVVLAIREGVNVEDVVAVMREVWVENDMRAQLA